MPTLPPVNSFSSSSVDPPLELELELPDFTEEDSLLMKEQPSVTFAEQIAHAQLLLKWKKGNYEHPPRQIEPFVME